MALASATAAQPAGTPDPLFGTNGRATLDAGRTVEQRATALAVQPDGKLVVVGEASDGGSPRALAVTRYNTDGSLDRSFGADGHATVGAGSSAHTYAVALQSNGAIVVAGSVRRTATGDDFAVARFTPDGALDSSFGGSGLVVTSFLTSFQTDIAHALTIQPDGKIVVAGTTRLQGPSGSEGVRAFGVARYTSDGALDPSFSGDGLAVVRSRSDSSGDTAAAVALEPGGKIILAGSANDVGGLGGWFAVARLTAAGTLDAAFGQGGIVREEARQSGWTAIALGDAGRIVLSGTACTANCFANNTVFAARAVVLGPSGATQVVLPVAVSDATSAQATAVVARPDGGAVVGGYATVDGRTRFVLAAFLASGQPDPSFGTAGVTTTAFGPASDATAAALALQPDGRLVSAGATYAPETGGSSYALARYTAAGVLDTSFGTDGLVTTTGVAPGDDVGRAVAVQPDGRIVVAATAGSAPNARLIVARLDPDGAPDATFGVAGVAPSIPNASANAVAVQPDGRIVVAGAFLLQANSRSSFGITRTLGDGTPDLTFGIDGVVIVGTTGYQTEARGVCVLPDGDLLAVGSLDHVFTVVRLSPAGMVRTTTPIVFTPPGNTPYSNGIATAVAVQPDGRVVVAGLAIEPSFSSANRYAVVARLTADGALDPTFGSGGRAYSRYGRSYSSFSIDALALQPDGRIVIGGRTESSPFVAGFTSAGAPDPVFGAYGEAILDVPVERVAGMAVDEDGRLVVTGPPAGLGADFIVARYTTVAAPDTAFGATGYVQMDVEGEYDGAAAVALDGDRIVAVGYGTRATSVDIAAVRLLGGESGTPAEPGPGAARIALAAFPNPASGRLTVQYTVPLAGRVRLTLTDVLGRSVAVVADGERPAGPSSSVVDTSRLSAGLYFVRLIAGTATATLRVTVAR